MAWSFTSPLSSRHLRDHDPPLFGSRFLIHEDGWTEVSHRGRSRNDHQRPSFDCVANKVGTKQTAAPRASPPLELPIIKADGMTDDFINPISQATWLFLDCLASQRSLDRNFLFSGDATWLHVPCPSSNPLGEHVIVASLSNPVTLAVLPPCLPPVLGN
ncbi:hypothetical protein AMTRI_Chr07g82360 [Amborella trichopoda]